MVLGDAVIEAGLEAWQPRGLSLHALDDIGDSTTICLGVREQATARRGLLTQQSGR